MTSTETATHRLTLVRTIDAPRERIFDAWLDPEWLARFIRPAPGVTVANAVATPEVGGEFLVLMQLGEREMPHRGQYREITRPERLEFTWISANAGDDSYVVLELEALGPERTRLTLHHEHLPSEPSRSDHEGGWESILATLASMLGTTS